MTMKILIAGIVTVVLAVVIFFSGLRHRSPEQKAPISRAADGSDVETAAVRVEPLESERETVAGAGDDRHATVTRENLNEWDYAGQVISSFGA